MTAALSRLGTALDRLLDGLRAVSSVCVWIGGGLLMLLTLGITAEVIMRSAFNHSFTGMDELGGYVLAIVSALAFTEGLFHRSHIRIDVIHAMLPRWGRAVLDLLALLSVVVFFGLLLWYAHLLLARSWALDARSVSPLSVRIWIPQGLWFLGLAFFVATSVVLLVRNLLALALGDLATITREIGIKGAEDEIEEERSLSAAARGEARA